MATQKSVTNITLIMVLGMAIAACGGGGGGGSSNGPGGGHGPGTLSGLDGDADNQDLLYFSHSYEVGEDPGTGQTLYHSVLYALDPANPEAATAVPMDTQDSTQGGDMGRTHYTPLYEADIDDTDGSVSNYRVANVLFLHNRLNGSETSEGFARVGTRLDAADPVRVTSETYLGAWFTGAGTLVRQNYADADRATVVYGLPGNEKRARMHFSASDAPQQVISSTVRHIAASRENDSPGFQRYLILRTHDDLQCSGGHRLVMAESSINPGTGSLQSIGVDNLLPGNKEAQDAAPLGGPLNDGSQYLVIQTLVDQGNPACDAEGATLWRYSPTAINQLVQVLNEHNDPLIFPEAAFGGLVLPEARHLAREGDVLYFGIAGAFDTQPQNLYRVEGNSWSLLSEQEDPLGYYTGFVIASNGRVVASVGNEVVSWNGDGSDRQGLDISNAAWLGIRTEVLGSRDGWVFYNRADITGRDDAVAMKIDGSDSLVIENSHWIGASLSGDGESISNMTELSEVFLVNPDKEIAAISAADPKAGRVVLGVLDGSPDAAAMYGLAPGPHRLIQVHLNADASEVYYVNTREQGSLRRALDHGEASGVQRPVTGF